jgi:hypothetical protein
MNAKENQTGIKKTAAKTHAHQSMWKPGSGFNTEYTILHSPRLFMRCGSSLSPAIGPLPPRKAKDGYHSHEPECFTLVLISEIGDCATGIVHGVILELETSDAQFLTHEPEGMRNISALGQGERQVFLRIWRVDRRLLS